MRELDGHVPQCLTVAMSLFPDSYVNKLTEPCKTFKKNLNTLKT